MTHAQDAVDRHLAESAHEFPDLDLATEGLVSRIFKLARYFERNFGIVAESFGITLSDWDLLSALRHAGPSSPQTPGWLAQALMVSPGTMTSHLDRLERRGLVQRRPDPKDRRCIRVELTEEGLRTWRGAVGVSAAKEQVVAGCLDEDDKGRFNDLLRTLMLYFESAEGPAPSRAALGELRKRLDASEPAPDTEQVR
ncbi:MAG: MarR family winged helix-turn-helix transcriptional regulator [Actinomycetota bacterium]